MTNPNGNTAHEPSTIEDQKDQVLYVIREMCPLADWRYEDDPKYIVLTATLDRIRVRIYAPLMMQRDHQAITPYSAYVEYLDDKKRWRSVEATHYFPTLFEAARRTAVWLNYNHDAEYEVVENRPGILKAARKTRAPSGKNTL